MYTENSGRLCIENVIVVAIRVANKVVNKVAKRVAKKQWIEYNS